MQLFWEATLCSSSGCLHHVVHPKCVFISLHVFHQHCDTYSLPPIKPLLTMSPPLLFPLLAPSYISLLTFCLPLLCSLSAFFSSSLPFLSLHRFPNCLHFLSTPSFSLKINWITFTQLLSSHSLSCWVNASSVTGLCVYTCRQENRERD